MAENDLNMLIKRRTSFFSTTMSVAFIFLLPAFFFYHWFGNVGALPMLLGGYSNESSALVITWSVLYLLLDIAYGRFHHKVFSNAELMYGVFMLYFSSVAITHWIIGTERQVSVSHFASIIQLTAAFFVFRYASLDSLALRRVLMATVVGMTVLVYQSAFNDTLTLMLAATDNAKVATYQGLARMFLLSVVVIIAFTQSRYARFLYCLNATVVIFLLGARSEVAGVLVFAAGFELCLVKRKGLVLFFMFLFLFTGAVVLIVFLPLFNELLPDSRVLSLLMDYQSDGSVQERGELNQFAMKTINASPFFGSYGSYVEMGGAGSYAHNILSAWVDIGVVGFGLMLTLIVVIFMNLQLKLPKLKPMEVALQALGVGLLVQTIFFMVAAKGFTDVSIAVLVGVTGALRERLRQHVIH
jgi:hypothetical protein